MSPFPGPEGLVIGLAHAAYKIADEFSGRNTGLQYYDLGTKEDLARRIAELDVLVVSGLWDNALLADARRLRFIQSVSSGTNQFDLAALRMRGIRLASAGGVNQLAVAEHAMALILALSRQLHLARDYQRNRVWSAGYPGIENRQWELAGRTLLIVGVGRIGETLAARANAFGMRVIGINRQPRPEPGILDASFGLQDLPRVLPQADFVVLTCPLTEMTRGLIGAAELGLMKRSSYLVNVARGPVVDEEALIEALRSHKIRGAALDCFTQEPLPESSPLWDMENVLITAHTAGETSHYEQRLIDLLLENLRRLWEGEGALTNEVL